MNRKRIILALCGFVGFLLQSKAQRFRLFSEELKSEYPSVVYEFLERYLFEIDSLQTHGEYVNQRLRDDKVLFLTGNASSARRINPSTPFSINKTDNKFYEVLWTDSLGGLLLNIAFPMQYELLLGKSKLELETVFQDVLNEPRTFVPCPVNKNALLRQEDGCLMTHPTVYYYVESMNTASFYRPNEVDSLVVTFSSSDKWHSAANLFHGCLGNIDDYVLCIEQNLYGFKKKQYTVSLMQWLAYCQAMKMKVYFAVEEEREDGLKALLIAQSEDLGFNHMLSLIIPNNFVEKHNAVIKASLHTYIPMQNVKDLYQQYVKKPKNKI